MTFSSLSLPLSPIAHLLQLKAEGTLGSPTRMNQFNQLLQDHLVAIQSGLPGPLPLLDSATPVNSAAYRKWFYRLQENTNVIQYARGWRGDKTQAITASMQTAEEEAKYCSQHKAVGRIVSLQAEERWNANILLWRGDVTLIDAMRDLAGVRKGMNVVNPKKAARGARGLAAHWSQDQPDKWCTRVLDAKY